MSPCHTSRLFLAGIALLCVWLYWPGIHGPLLFDDDWNLAGINHWLAGDIPAFDALFRNRSGPTGRPLSILSLAANLSTTGMSVPALKLTNIFLHIACGLAIYAFARRLFSLDAAPGKAAWMAAGLAAWWLLHPLAVSTSLYTIQRMTQMATLFGILSCHAYLVARLENSRKGLLYALLFLLLACASKEIALQLPGAFLLLECLLSTRKATAPSTLHTHALRLALLPAGLMLAAWAASILYADTYLWRGYDVSTRLLSEARVVMTYLAQIITPDSAGFGIYHDDFLPSRSLTTPTDTLPAVVFMTLLVTGSAIGIFYRQYSLPAFGLAFFLLMHVMESSVIPVELYFEHRNYLPSLGIGITLFWLLGQASSISRKTVATAAVAYLAVFAFMLHQRVAVWANEGLLLSSSALQHPASPRAASDLAEYHYKTRRPDLALQTLGQIASERPDYEAIALLQAMTFYCRSHLSLPDALGRRFAESTNRLGPFYTPLSIGLEALMDYQRQGQCRPFSNGHLSSGLLAWERQASHRLGEHRQLIWQQRIAIVDVLLASGKTGEAIRILDDIWSQPEAPPMAGLMLATAWRDSGDLQRARATLEQLERASHNAPAYFQADIQNLRRQITSPKP